MSTTIVCQRCGRQTANLGRVCTACLYRPLEGRPWRNKPNGRRRYTDELIKTVHAAYIRAKERRVRGPVQAVSKELGMPASAVGYIIVAYKEQADASTKQVQQPQPGDATNANV